MQQRLSGREEGSPPEPNRVLLIDYDEALSEVMAALLETDGLAVFQHTCPPGACVCREELLRLKPDLVLVNVAESAYTRSEHRGWRCLQNLSPLAMSEGALVVGYTIFDESILLELGLDTRTLPVPLHTEVSSPGDFARKVNARLADSLVA